MKYYLARMIYHIEINGISHTSDMMQLVIASNRKEAKKAVKKDALENEGIVIDEIFILHTIIGE